MVEIGRSRDTGLARVNRMAGLRSRLAGIAFAGLTVAFLALALRTGYFVFEVDSVLTLLAAIVLLLADPRRRIQTRVVDALVGTSEEMASQLLGKENGEARYVYFGKTVQGISLARAEGDPRTKKRYIPPGRGLANLFLREIGLEEVTKDVLVTALPDVITENFGLAASLEVEVGGDSLSFVLREPSFGTICAGPPTVGCPVSSCLAILVCAAWQRAVSLESCTRDAASDTVTIVVKLLTLPGEAV
jgi:hypothetical protein